MQLLFPEAVAIEADPGDPGVIRVRGPEKIPLGWALRTSPAADRVIGCQGPTDALVGFDTENKVAGVAVLESFDNEPYVGYVRDDWAFRGLWRGMPIEEVAGIDPAATGVEGVSGATMTSQAVAEGIVRAARERRDRGPAAAGGWAGIIGAWLRGIEPPQWGAIGVIVAGVVTAFTRLRGTWLARLPWTLVAAAILATVMRLPLALVDLEPFDAYLPLVAGIPALLIFGAGLAASARYPKAYCRHGCPTGALLDHLRLNRKSGSFTWRDGVLARIDAAASTWRADSDASRFNRAAAGEWVEVGEDLAQMVAIARHVHAETDGAFDITVGPLVQLWRDGRRPTEAELIAARRLVGMDLVESRPATAGRPAAVSKTRDGVMLDLGGIGPGYGVAAVADARAVARAVAAATSRRPNADRAPD